MKKRVLVSLLIMLGLATQAPGQQATVAGRCMACHKEKTTGLYNQWLSSAHGTHNVTCIDCHGAEKGDADAYLHEGALIATLVTPRDCGTCHEKEAEQVSNSYHATAGQILDSQDAYLAMVGGGHPVAITGCESCHGAKVEIDPDAPNKLSGEDWPNSGIGRINPDGSLGSCNACHQRHGFTKRQARQPEACSKCHLGPDHPQKEIYEESKHGNTYYTHKDQMNLGADRWVVGQDYFAAPTCATCHMSATRTQEVDHDVGLRISWTLRPPISEHKDNWRAKRENMQDVCSACHEDQFVQGHYYQYDAVVRLYNEKFAGPATEIMNMIQEKNLLEYPASFANAIEWTYWELWHHEGRRGRMGASMMGPDYTWWHGIYEVIKHFYFKFIPDARAYGDPEVNAYIENLLQDTPMHQWVTQPTPDLKEAIRSGDLQEIYDDLFQYDQE